MNKKSIINVIKYIVLTLFAIITLFPFYWMLSSSFKTQTDLLATPPKWLFTPTLANYLAVYSDGVLLRAVGNSLIVAVFATIVSVGLGAPAAYALARYNFRGKADLWFWFISNRMITPVALALPIYIIAKTLGL